MENLSFTYSHGQLHIGGFPGAQKLIEVTGNKAHHAASYMLYYSDLRHAEECLVSMNLISNLTVRDALFKNALMHYGKCFGEDIRTSINFRKVFKNEPEALSVHEYFINLRNKHVVHDENDYTQCKVGAVLNKRDSPALVPKVICTSMRADTVDQQHWQSMRQLVTHVIKYVEIEYEKICNSIIEDYEKMGYEELLELPSLNIGAPASQDPGLQRSK